MATVTTTNTPSVDLRHMTSNPNVHAPSPTREREQRSTSNRHSQILHVSPPRKSSNSIPSSPTSVHSSSSAIFERDVEPIPCPSPPHPHHPPNPHRIPRSKTTETIEQSVPSVLDSAAEILASLDNSQSMSDAISVVAPATHTSGFASPIGSFRSRSPSPFGSPAHRASLLLSTHSPASIAGVSAASPVSPMSLPQSMSLSPSQQPQSPAPLGPNPRPTPTVQAQATPDVPPASGPIAIPGSIESSPRRPVLEVPMHSVLSSSPSHQPSLMGSAFPVSPLSISPLSSSHPPSPSHNASKRLSFMSYADLLSSTPASTIPLSSLTTAASTVEPPPHIPVVSGYTQAQSAATSLKDFLMGPAIANVRDWDSVATLDDIGGEWEREGLGRGLESRLEALMPLPGRA
ncbi:hypothetical protein HGRIS_014658 [Hohenbuehelia grisea]|uniref:Uncharacterized protein n=1 Tax=Hohenbuehelia grisea TaxID=104357 RepID=A0ABR3JW44_9AGAR